MTGKILWRKNVLALVGAGYATLLMMFFLMVYPGDMTPEGAYEIIKGPLMALIGGSLAISKDLIPFQDILITRDNPADHHSNADDDRESAKPNPEK